MSTGSILLVEDNPQDEMLIMRALCKNGLADDVAVVRDGQQAVDYLFREGEFNGRNDIELPAVVLLDIGLPRLSGLEVLARLRADPRTRLLPVVMFTSSDEERDRIQSYQLGANSFVQKPLELAEFTDLIERLGMYWLVNNAQSSTPPCREPRWTTP